MTIGLIRLGFSLTPPDVTAPSVPTGLTVVPGNATATLSWTASTDTVGVVGYKLYKEGVFQRNITSGTSTVESSLTNGTNYHYSLSAYDAAGNESAQANFAAFQPYVTYAADTFTRSDSSTVGSTETGGYTWAAIGGGGSGWSILTNKLSKANGTGTSTAPNIIAFSDGQANGMIAVTFLNGALAQGYAFREASDGSGGWLVSVDATGAWLLRRHTGTTYTTIASHATTGTATNKHVLIFLNGSSISVYLEGALIMSATDSTYSTNTYQGPWVASTNQIGYDDVIHTSQLTLAT